MVTLNDSWPGSDWPSGESGDCLNGRSNGFGIMQKIYIYNNKTQLWAGLRFKFPGHFSVPVQNCSWRMIRRFFKVMKTL